MGAASEETAPIAGYYNTESNVCSIPTRWLQLCRPVVSVSPSFARKTSSKPGTRHSGGGKIYRYEIPNHVLTMGAYPNTKMMTIPTGSTYFM